MAEGCDVPKELGLLIDPDLNEECVLRNSEDAKATQRQYKMRAHRELTKEMRSYLMAEWDRYYKSYTNSRDKLIELCNKPKGELSPGRITIENERMRKTHLKSKDSERHLIFIQSQLEDPSLQADLQSIQAFNIQHANFLSNCDDSQTNLQAKDTSNEKAESELSHRSYRASAHASKKASSFHPKPARSHSGSNVSQQSYITGSNHSSKASSHHSRSSRASSEESLAALAILAQIEADEAAVDLQVADEERLQEEEVAKAIAQANRTYLQHKREAAKKAVRATALRAEAANASLNFNPTQLEGENLQNRVEAYVNNQNSLRQGQGGESQPLVSRTIQNADTAKFVQVETLLEAEKFTPTSQDTRGNQIVPSALVKDTQQADTRVAASHNLNVEAAVFQPQPQGNSRTDVKPIKHDRPAQRRKEQPSHVSWQDVIINKYSADTEQLSLASAPDPRDYAYQDPRETPDPAFTNSIWFSLPSPPKYKPHTAQMDFATPRERKTECPPRQGKVDLASRGAQKFSDKPGRDYLLWKHIFLHTVRDERLRPIEEIIHLMAWLGPESTRVVKDIYSSHLGDPVIALKQAWEVLDQRFGASTLTESSLLERVSDFPVIRTNEPHRLWDFSILLTQLRAAKEDPNLTGLACLDQHRTQKPIVRKLPTQLIEKWIELSDAYRERNLDRDPPFAALQEFVAYQTKRCNDPRNRSFRETEFPTTKRANYNSDFKRTTQMARERTIVSVHKTQVAASSTSKSDEHPSKRALPKTLSTNKDPFCPLHKSSHSLNKCRNFGKKPLEERKALIREYRLCFKCCESTEHMAKACTNKVQCHLCGSDRHPGALHPDSEPTQWTTPTPPLPKESQDNTEAHREATASINCTTVCGGSAFPRLCHEIYLTKVYPTGHPEEAVKMYVMLDGQSNQSLARSAFFDLFNVRTDDTSFTISTCTGSQRTAGRKVTGFCIESLDGSAKLKLPPLLEWDALPDDRNQIATPEVASNIPHLKHMASLFPALDPEAEILLLLGLDASEAFLQHDQVRGPAGSPFARKSALGWAILGTVCIDRLQAPTQVNVFATSILSNGRASHFKQCHEHFTTSTNNPVLGATVFETSKEDNDLAWSIEDKDFLQLMDKELQQDASGSWVAPLPFRTPRQRLPNNHEQALSRLFSLRRLMNKKPPMRDHLVAFIDKMLQNRHAELAPPLEEGEECWYLPFFGVYHPQKPGQIRVVFDASAKFQGFSLNKALLTGPDLINSLLGVLIRFRKEAVAFMADIQQMFYSFLVREDHRNYLRFLWFSDEQRNQQITEYRMRVHVFGNGSSPAIANYGLQRTARIGETKYGTDARRFVERDFYVDDGLKSVATPAEAIDLLNRTRQMLAVANLTLHKIASNSEEVLEAFSPEDHAKGLQDLDFTTDMPLIQRSLGLCWDLKKDAFTFRVPAQKSNFTRRGILSTVNSLFDPLGFAAPVTIQGRLLLRTLSQNTKDWDEPLPPDQKQEWEKWCASLRCLQNVSVQRTYVPVSPAAALKKELHVFSDASTKAIAAVGYIRVYGRENNTHIGFVMGKAKIAPQQGHTVPRLELCGAVLAVELADLIKKTIDLELQTTIFYTDSKVVLGYIHNQSRRFYVYVSNRVDRIRKSSEPEQWRHVPTDQNPADHATRSIPASQLAESTWIKGPEFLTCQDTSTLPGPEHHELINPDQDADIRSQVLSKSTTADEKPVVQATIFSTMVKKTKILPLDHNPVPVTFENFSRWRSVLRGVAAFIRFLRRRANLQISISESHLQAQRGILRWVQHDAYPQEFEWSKTKKPIPKSSPLLKLNPYLDRHGMLRVGGRLEKAELDLKTKHPIILPARHHVTNLLVQHHHETVHHQGRHFTEGAVRAAELWIVGGKRLIATVLHKCLPCRKQRRGSCNQLMADLPIERLSTEPPFTNVGVDVFGPWAVCTRRTRGGQADSKRWAVLFTCLSIRAVHIEVIESMDSSSFINALRRFQAHRGPVKVFRSDRGTNFVGACKELQIDESIRPDSAIDKYLKAHDCEWTFNPPHASHMGGSWERMIGIARKILDSMLLKVHMLTHETLTTLMAEVAAIINARPLGPVSTDPENPSILAPATLLTYKTGDWPAPVGNFVPKDMYRQQWRQVQWLANTFWKRWKQEYLPTLQERRKWQNKEPNLEDGDLVLLKDKEAHRNSWPMGLVHQVLPSKDGLVRQVAVQIVKPKESGGNQQTFTKKLYTRPITDLVLLLRKTELED